MAHAAPAAAPKAPTLSYAFAAAAASAVGAATCLFEWSSSFTPVDFTSGDAVVIATSILYYWTAALIAGVAAIVLIVGVRNRALYGLILASGLLSVAFALGFFLSIQSIAEDLGPAFWLNALASLVLCAAGLPAVLEAPGFVVMSRQTTSEEPI